MAEKSYYRKGLEWYLRNSEYAERLDSFSDEELYEAYHKYLKDQGIDEEKAEATLREWFFTNR